jgi:hypothetical protein
MVTTHLPKGKKVNVVAITQQQATKMDLDMNEAMEMVEFVALLSNAGHNHWYQLEMQKIPCQPINSWPKRGPIKKTNAPPAKPAPGGPFDPPED